MKKVAKVIGIIALSIFVLIGGVVVALVACTSSAIDEASSSEVEFTEESETTGDNETVVEEPVIKEWAIYESDECTIVVQYDPENSSDIFSDILFTAKVDNFGDRNLSVTFQDFSVNGYMVNGINFEDISAGKKANIELSLFGLDETGIESVEDVEFTLQIQDGNTYDTIFEDVITLE